MRVWRFLVWFVVVSALITMFGVMTAPPLLVLIADMIVGTLIIRDLRASLSSFYAAYVRPPVIDDAAGTSSSTNAGVTRQKF